MNVLKKVREFFQNSDSVESYGIINAAPKEQLDKMRVCMRLLKNSGKLFLPNVISGEIARLVCLELRSKIEGGKRAEYLKAQYDKVLLRVREITETAAGLGGVILKPYVTEGGIEVSAITPDMFIPTDISPSGRIMGGVFIDTITKGDKVYTRLEAHGFASGEYLIENKCFIKDRFAGAGREVPLSDVDEWRSIKKKVTIKGLSSPLFAYFKMPNSTAEQPLGESVFSRSVKLIADAEKQYERLLWEFESGERALYVDDAAIRYDDDNASTLPQKRLYRLINQENLFSDWTPELREASIINGLDEILRRIEFNSGLAYGTLSRVDSSDKTAEEVRASKQRSYAKVAEIQGALKLALCDLVRAMDALCDLYKLCVKGDYEMSFEFDDSLIADRAREFEERLALLEKGVISNEQMHDWYFGKE